MPTHTPGPRAAKRRKIGRPKSVTPPAPATWTSHDLRRSLLVFDSWRLRHMNSPHTRGDRYAIVLYNKDSQEIQVLRTGAVEAGSATFSFDIEEETAKDTYDLILWYGEA